MELIILIIVGVIFGLFKDTKSNNTKSQGGLSEFQKYETFNKFRNKK